MPVDGIRDCASCGKTANTVSGWSTDPPIPQRFPSEESQDQTAEMTMGLGMATRLVNDAGIQDKAADALARMISWIPQPKNDNGRPDEWWINNTGTISQLPPPYPWLIKNPVSDHCVYSGGGSEYYGKIKGCSGTGAMFVGNATPAAKAVDFVCAGYNSGRYGSLANWLQNTASVYNPSFQLEQLIDGNIQPDIQFTDAFVSFARNWELAPPMPPRPGPLLYPPWAPWPPFPIPVYNSSWMSIKKHSNSAEFQTPHIPLIYQLNYGYTDYHPENGADLHDGKYYQIPSYQHLFDVSAPCGNYNYDNKYGSWGDWEWSCTNRLSHAFNRFSSGHTHNSDFSGVDYIDLFALYNLVEGDYLKCVINPYYIENYNTPYPDGAGYGVHGKQLMLNFLEYLSLNNQIAGNGAVSFRGAKVIDLNPGFEAQPGSFSDLYVQDYTCNNLVGDRYHFALEESGKDGSGAPLYKPIQYCPTHQPYIAHDLPKADPQDFFTPPDWVEHLIDEVLGRGVPGNTYPPDADADTRKAIDEKLSGIGANKMDHAPHVLVSPNPNTGIFRIWTGYTADYQVSITNALGAVVYHQAFTAAKDLDIVLPAPRPGEYFVKVVCKDFTGSYKITVIQ